MDIEQIRTICLGFPHAKEDIKWGSELCFLIGEKMFCMAGLEPPGRISFKVSKEQFDELSALPHFIPAPYLARAKWVSVINPSALSKTEWQNYLRQSYELVKATLPAKIRKSLG